jgi:hypothetical protein
VLTTVPQTIAAPKLRSVVFKPKGMPKAKQLINPIVATLNARMALAVMKWAIEAVQIARTFAAIGLSIEAAARRPTTKPIAVGSQNPDVSKLGALPATAKPTNTPAREAAIALANGALALSACGCAVGSCTLT